MNKKFHRRSKLFHNHFSKNIDLMVRFTDIEIPGDGHVTIYMKHIAEFYYPEIMDINPVGESAVVDKVNHFSKDFLICFIHNSGHRFAGYTVTDNHDYNTHDNGHDAV